MAAADSPVDRKDEEKVPAQMSYEELRERDLKSVQETLQDPRYLEALGRIPAS